MKRGKKDNLKTMVYIAAFAAVVLLLPQLFRIYSGNPTVMGGEPYYHARLADMILEGNYKTNDWLIYGGRQLDLTPYHFVLAGASYITGTDFALRSVPVLIGILSALVFYLILRRFRADRLMSIVSVVILSSSPVFIYTFNSTQDSLALLFTLIGAYFFFGNDRKSIFLSIVFFMMASLFSLFNVLLIVIPLLIYSFARKRKQKVSMAIFFLLAFVYLVKPTPVFYKLTPISGDVLTEVISDIGGMFGIGIFYFILAIIGIIATWNDKKRYYPFYMILILLGAAFYFAGSYVMVYMNFYLSIFAALGFIKIKEINWQMKMVKNLTFIIIVCGLLFSMISFSTRIADLPPYSRTFTSLQWLKENSKEEFVASHYLNGYFIEYIAERPVLIDGYSISAEDLSGRQADLYSLFHATELNRAEDIMKRYGIRYVMVTSDMKQGIVWERPDEGLLYLFRNNETFKNVYSSKEIEIWKYIKNA